MFLCYVGLVCAWLPYIDNLGYANCSTREGGTFQLLGVSVLSEGVNVVQLHTDCKISPIRYVLDKQQLPSHNIDIIFNRRCHT